MEKQKTSWKQGLKKDLLSISLIMLVGVGFTAGLMFTWVNFFNPECNHAVIIDGENKGSNPAMLLTWVQNNPYGQNFEQIDVYENSTGSWVLVDNIYPADTGYVDIPQGCSIRLNSWNWINSTLTGSSDFNDAINRQRHNVSVQAENDTVIFTQQNFTYYSRDHGIDPPLWLYEYRVILNFVTDWGEYYNITLMLETFW